MLLSEFRFNLHRYRCRISISIADISITLIYFYFREYGYDDGFKTYGCITGIIQAAFAFGAFIGPTLGAFGVERIGFGWTATVIAFINVIFVFILTISMVTRSKVHPEPVKIFDSTKK